MKKLKILKILSLCFLCGLFATNAFAANGVLNINQACAAQLGCFSGDTAGYPITIDGSAGASYRLTSDLIVPNADTDGIQVAATDISIDLNGFSIVGAACVGVLTNCTPTVPSLGSGVNVLSTSNYYGTSVKNGSVVGMGQYGLYLRGFQSEAIGIKARWNQFDGIYINTGSIARGNRAYQNGRYGFRIGAGSTVENNVAYANGDDGIVAGRGVTISENTVYLNEGDGIVADNGSNIQRNTVRLNSGYGLNLDPTAAYQENIISNNIIGTVNFGFNLFGNFCNTDGVCP